METVAQNLSRRTKHIIGLIKQNSEEATNILDLGDDVKSVHILAGIVVYTHPMTSEGAVFTLGYQYRGKLFPVISIGPKENDIRVANENWEFAKEVVEVAEVQLSNKGFSVNFDHAPKAKVA